MAVFRIEKSKDYTVMSNYHLRDSALSLKAKGLLSQMLSLPEGWDYTLLGLAQINKEGKDSIRAALVELEEAGYILRSRVRDGQGRLRGADYIVYESPQPRENKDESPMSENPTLENPTQENPTLGNPTQLNIDISSKDIKEKINKKEKRPTAKIDFEPMPLFKNWIATVFEAEPPDRKNRLYFAIAGFVENRTAIKKPIKSKGAITALCNRLLRLTCDCDDYLEAMIELLEDATTNNWQTVYARTSPGGSQAPPPSGRRYEVI